MLMRRGLGTIHRFACYLTNNIHEKLLDFDWVKAVQFKCNTSGKSVTPFQITHRNSGL